MDVEIGMGKTARRAYGFDEVAIVPSRRTRDPEDVSIAWEIDAFTFRLPMLASAMDAATSPATAVEVGRLGGLAVLNLEGLFTRYEDPEPIFEEIAELPDEKATRRMQELYAEPLKDELVVRRIREIKEGGVVVCDNAEGFGFQEGFLGRGFERVDFFGYTPGVSKPHCTAFYFRAGCFLFSDRHPIPDVSK